MAISFVAATTFTSGASTTSSVVLTYPTHLVGDIMIAQVLISSSTATITTPAGWTLIRSDTGNNRRSSLYVHSATDSDAGTIAFPLSTSVNAVGGIVDVRGVDTTTPVAASAGQTNGSSATCTAPSVTATKAGDWLLTFSSGVGNLTFTPAAGQTERWDVTTTAGGSNSASELATEALAGSGATGTRASTMSGATTSLGQSIVLSRALDPPSAPTGLTATAISATQIDLAWTDTASDETGFTVERSANGGSSWGVVTSSLAANTTSYSDTGRAPQTTYLYRVKATNSGGSSAYSATASATTLLRPALTFYQPAQIALFDSPGGRQLADLSARLTDATSETDEHGCASTALTARLSIDAAAALTRQALGAHLAVTIGGGVIWSGRVEEPGFTVDADGAAFTCTAYGYQQAFDDLPYIALWSDASYDRWYPWQTGFTTIEKWTMDQQGRLFMGAKGSVYGNLADSGAFRYDIPAGSTRNLTTILFDAAVLLPTNWIIDLRDTTTFAVLWTKTGNGALQTFNAQSVSVNTRSVYFQVYNSTGATVTLTNDSQYYFRALNVSVKTAASVTPDAIVTDMLSAVRAVNPSQLHSSTAYVQAPGLTLPDESYTDANMRDVLDTLAGYGDTATPPNRYAWRVWADQIARFTPVSTGSMTYVVSVGAYQADQALKQVATQLYARYTDSSGVAQVTSTATVTGATPRIIRRLAIQSQSTTSAQATQERDAAVADQQQAKPRVSMTIQRISDTRGARVPLYRLRAGDVLELRDLVPTLSTAVDRFRRFRVIHTRMDWISGTMDVDLESPQPQLDWLLARREIGL
ncbi:MAG TPA: fibronectin type III domain-containing protein [Roseiflexaceae bacterium]|nr:fibronectin type III domain-containing protein [Roseiflexaceae bacterium]